MCFSLQVQSNNRKLAKALWTLAFHTATFYPSVGVRDGWEVESDQIFFIDSLVAYFSLQIREGRRDDMFPPLFWLRIFLFNVIFLNVVCPMVHPVVTHRAYSFLLLPLLGCLVNQGSVMLGTFFSCVMLNCFF